MSTNYIKWKKIKNYLSETLPSEQLNEFLQDNLQTFLRPLLHKKPNHELRKKWLKGETKFGNKPLSQKHINHVIEISNKKQLNEKDSYELFQRTKQIQKEYGTDLTTSIEVEYYKDREYQLSNLIELFESQLSEIIKKEIKEIIKSFLTDLIKRSLVKNIVGLIHEIYSIVKRLDGLSRSFVRNELKMLLKILLLIFRTMDVSVFDFNIVLILLQKSSQSFTLKNGKYEKNEIFLISQYSFFALVSKLLEYPTFKLTNEFKFKIGSNNTHSDSLIGNQKTFLQTLNKILAIKNWKNTYFYGGICFVTSIFLYSIQTNKNYQNLIANYLNMSFQNHVFDFLKSLILSINPKNNLFFQLADNMVINFIFIENVLNDLKQKEIEFENYIQNSNEINVNEQESYTVLTEFLYFLSALYSGRPKLSLKYLESDDYKLIPILGEYLTLRLYHPFTCFFTSLINDSKCAHHGSEYLKAKANQRFCWKHFFYTIDQFCLQSKTTQMINLNQVNETTIIEFTILSQIIELICKIVFYEGESGNYLIKESNSSYLNILFRFIKCPFPTILKAGVYHTLTSFSKTGQIAEQIWKALNQMKINSRNNIIEDFQLIETQYSRYPELISFLILFNNLLINSKTIPNIGKEGLWGYIKIFLESVFLKLEDYHYKKIYEKYYISFLILKIFDFILQLYYPTLSDFDEKKITPQQKAGFEIMYNIIQGDSIFRILKNLILLKIPTSKTINDTNNGNNNNNNNKEYEDLENKKKRKSNMKLKKIIEKNIEISLKILNIIYNLQNIFREFNEKKKNLKKINNFSKIILQNPNLIKKLLILVTYINNEKIGHYSINILQNLCLFKNSLMELSNILNDGDGENNNIDDNRISNLNFNHIIENYFIYFQNFFNDNNQKSNKNKSYILKKLEKYLIIESEKNYEFSNDYLKHLLIKFKNNNKQNIFNLNSNDNLNSNNDNNNDGFSFSQTNSNKNFSHRNSIKGSNSNNKNYKNNVDDLYFFNQKQTFNQKYFEILNNFEIMEKDDEQFLFEISILEKLLNLILSILKEYNSHEILNTQSTFVHSIFGFKFKEHGNKNLILTSHSNLNLILELVLNDDFFEKRTNLCNLCLKIILKLIQNTQTKNLIYNLINIKENKTCYLFKLIKKYFSMDLIKEKKIEKENLINYLNFKKNILNQQQYLLKILYFFFSQELNFEIKNNQKISQIINFLFEYKEKGEFNSTNIKSHDRNKLKPKQSFTPNNLRRSQSLFSPRIKRIKSDTDFLLNKEDPDSGSDSGSDSDPNIDLSLGSVPRSKSKSELGFGEFDLNNDIPFITSEIKKNQRNKLNKRKTEKQKEIAIDIEKNNYNFLKKHKKIDPFLISKRMNITKMLNKIKLNEQEIINYKNIKEKIKQLNNKHFKINLKNYYYFENKTTKFRLLKYNFPLIYNSILINYLQNVEIGKEMESFTNNLIHNNCYHFFLESQVSFFISWKKLLELILFKIVDNQNNINWGEGGSYKMGNVGNNDGGDDDEDDDDDSHEDDNRLIFNKIKNRKLQFQNDKEEGGNWLKILISLVLSLMNKFSPGFELMYLNQIISELLILLFSKIKSKFEGILTIISNNSKKNRNKKIKNLKDIESISIIKQLNWINIEIFTVIFQNILIPMFYINGTFQLRSNLYLCFFLFFDIIEIIKELQPYFNVKNLKNKNNYKDVDDDEDDDDDDDEYDDEYDYDIDDDEDQNINNDIKIDFSISNLEKNINLIFLKNSKQIMNVLINDSINNNNIFSTNSLTLLEALFRNQYKFFPSKENILLLIKQFINSNFINIFFNAKKKKILINNDQDDVDMNIGGGGGGDIDKDGDDDDDELNKILINSISNFDAKISFLISIIILSSKNAKYLLNLKIFNYINTIEINLKQYLINNKLTNKKAFMKTKKTFYNLLKLIYTFCNILPANSQLNEKIIQFLNKNRQTILILIEFEKNQSSSNINFLYYFTGIYYFISKFPSSLTSINFFDLMHQQLLILFNNFQKVNYSKLNSTTVSSATAMTTNQREERTKRNIEANFISFFLNICSLPKNPKNKKFSFIVNKKFLLKNQKQLNNWPKFQNLYILLNFINHQIFHQFQRIKKSSIRKIPSFFKVLLLIKENACQLLALHIYYFTNINFFNKSFYVSNNQLIKKLFNPLFHNSENQLLRTHQEIILNSYNLISKYFK
ncbi:hypothetical protein M0813_21901 [Anaeramoeba flamelloides]|uniref:Uncharacterized protein n=1 Tax=Anaeramoeba flamelloides TaxID=1746091 RepID=A0ABQ8YG10_9EUKA|nr:hypothetical protein M0813_21901 [Anaeramoeba flamelloides]